MIEILSPGPSRGEALLQILGDRCALAFAGVMKMGRD